MQHPRPFSSRLLPAPADGGFRMDGYWVWCGSAVRGEDGRYHLFAARWPHAYPFFQGYLVASEIVRAVPTTQDLSGLGVNRAVQLKFSTNAEYAGKAWGVNLITLKYILRRFTT
jgi:hypothetical protein